MSLQNLVNIPVRIVDLTIDVVARGTGDQPQDDVFVTAQLELLGDIADGEATLILPMASEAQQQPILRYTDTPINDAHTFTFDLGVDRSPLDDEVIESLADLADGASRREQRDLAVDIKRAAQSLSTTVVTVRPGQRSLRLFYAIAADKVADRQFEFSVIGPLPSFVIQAGGSIGVIAALPRNTQLVSAEALTDPQNPASTIPTTNASLGGRTVLGWFWQNDPLFRVRYRY